MQALFTKENIIFTIVVALIPLSSLTVGIFRLRKIPAIIKELLKDNRPSVNKGMGRHYADRLIDIWYKEDNRSLIDSFYLGDSGKGYLLLSAIDSRLEDLGLITKKRGKVLPTTKPVESFRNKIIVFLVKMNLIYCKGDDKDYYKRLNKRRKKMKAKNKN